MELISSNPMSPTVAETITPSQLERGENKPRITTNDDDVSPGCCQSTLQCISSIYESCHGLYVTCNRFYYRHTNRTVRNLVRIGFAGGMSTLGGGVAGDIRVRTFLHLSERSAVWIGATLGGVGNAASTWLAWETDVDARLAALEGRVTELQAARGRDDRVEIKIE